MEYKEIQNLIKLLDSTDLAEFKLKEGDFELLIRTKEYFKLGKHMKSQVVSNPFIQTPAPAADQIGSHAPEAPAVIQEANQATSASGTETKPATKILDIKSPIVGTFYRSPSPDKDAYVKIGDHINVGSIVCIVEAMKLFNEIESEVSGKLVEILVDDATPVEYEQILFRVEQA